MRFLQKEIKSLFETQLTVKNDDEDAMIGDTLTITETVQ